MNANPYYTVSLANGYAEVGIGPEHAHRMVLLGDVARAGVSISLHSDMPITPAKPLFLVWAAVNRTTTDGNTLGPNQRLNLERALRAVTIEAAYSLRLENEIGSIEAGKLANFTVLEESPFDVDLMAINYIGV